MKRHGTVLASLLLSAPCLGADPTFAEIVDQSFVSWDADGDGVISAKELDRLVMDRSVTGPDAAALAAMKLVVRAGKIEVPPLTREYLMKPPPRRGAAAAAKVDTDAEDREVRRPGVTASSQDPIAAINSRYTRALRKIKAANRDLFLDESPDLDKCRQGPLGSCFFIAGVGAAVDRDSVWVKSLFAVGDDGAYTVRFGDGRTVRIESLTDAELGLTSSTGDEGLWLAMLEKAYGTLRNDLRKEEDQTESATDAIARGGSLATTIRVLTGHVVERVTMRSRVEKADLNGESIEPIVSEVREKIAAALRERRLVGVSTDASDSGKRLPPGVSPNHAYAVLGFEEGIDLVHVWNPHGNTFRPKGRPCRENGYVTRAGRFDVPLEEFVRVFRGLSIETDRVPEPPPPLSSVKK